MPRTVPAISGNKPIKITYGPTTSTLYAENTHIDRLKKGTKRHITEVEEMPTLEDLEWSDEHLYNLPAIMNWWPELEIEDKHTSGTVITFNNPLELKRKLAAAGVFKTTEKYRFEIDCIVLSIPKGVDSYIVLFATDGRRLIASRIDCKIKSENKDGQAYTFPYDKVRYFFDDQENPEPDEKKNITQFIDTKAESVTFTFTGPMTCKIGHSYSIFDRVARDVPTILLKENNYPPYYRIIAPKSFYICAFNPVSWLHPIQDFFSLHCFNFGDIYDGNYKPEKGRHGSPECGTTTLTKLNDYIEISAQWYDEPKPKDARIILPTLKQTRFEETKGFIYLRDLYTKEIIEVLNGLKSKTCFLLIVEQQAQAQFIDSDNKTIIVLMRMTPPRNDEED